MTPQKYCEQKVRQSASSFYYSFLFLSPLQRDAMIALYAFCREIDDIVDHPGDENIAHNKLNWWKSEILTAFNNQASHPIAIAISHALKNYAFKAEYFLDIIQGMEMDLSHQGFETMQDLENYCYHAAGAVGLLTIEILGYKKEHQKNTEMFAKSLASSLQLINILRDVKEDFERNRIYIPRQEMNKFSVTKAMFKEPLNPQTKALFTSLGQQAENFYQLAMNALQNEDRYQQRSAIIMGTIYFTILKKIIKTNYPVLQQRVTIHPIQKLWLAWSTARKEAKREQLRTKDA
ncbi:MAG: presqualene diphosphate synthase HpnD [Pseudomonadota bacterium]